MKKLESRTVRELIALAREWGVSRYSKLKKAELIKLLTEKLPKRTLKQLNDKTATKKPAKAKTKEKKTAPERASSRSKAAKAVRQARRSASQARLPESVRYQPPTIREVETKPDWQVAIEELPRGYGDGRMGLIPRDPHWLYCFWDPTPDQIQRLEAGPRRLLRVVHVSGDQERQTGLIELTPAATSWYVNVDDAAMTYRCDLGLVGRDGEYECVLSSNRSTTPPETLAPPETPRFVPPPPPISGGHSPLEEVQEPAVSSGPEAESTARLIAMSIGVDQARGIDSADAQAQRRQAVLAGRARAGASGEFVQPGKKS
jgi:hypothetical protein